MKTSPAIPIPAVIERTAMEIKRANGANYQKVVREWISTRFGRTTLQDPQERIARVVEEAYELSQASGMEIADLEAIAAYVYARPLGEVKQEAAGVAVTLFALAEAHRFDLLLETEKEIERITHLPATISQRKQAAKATAGVGRFPDPPRLDSSVTQQEDLLDQVDDPTEGISQNIGEGTKNE